MSEPTKPVAPEGVSLSKAAEQPYTVITCRKRTIEMYHVLRQELDDLIAGYTAINLAFFGITFGAALALLITCTTAGLSEPLNSRYWFSFLGTGLLTAYFAIMSRKEWLNARKKVEQIKAETISEVAEFISQQK
jgi:hypothetical protein